MALSKVVYLPTDDDNYTVSGRIWDLELNLKNKLVYFDENADL